MGLRVCVSNKYKPCYGSYSTTVATIPFWILLCVIIRYFPRFILVESYLFLFSWNWPFGFSAVTLHKTSTTKLSFCMTVNGCDMGVAFTFSVHGL